MSRPKVFVSFSTADIQFIRRIFFRLHAQPLELWDYSQEGDEIPGGQNLNDYLRERIAACDVFLPIVSNNSFHSQYTPREVENALAIGRTTGQLCIIPIVASDCFPSDNWPAPYDKLQHLRYYAVRFRGPEMNERIDACKALEEVIERLCRDLGIHYDPLPIEDPRLPFMDRFDAELQSLEKNHHSFRHAEHHISIYTRLLETRNEIEESIAQGDYESALQCINYFIATCEHEILGRKFYYAYLVRAICLISGGRLPEAYDLLSELINHPMRDENVFGALGAVRQRQGAYADALKYYEAAAALDNEDSAAKHGMLLNGLLSGRRGGEDRLISEIEKRGALVVEDKTKIQALKAFVYGVLGRTQSAIQIYQQLIDSGQVSAAILVNFAHLLSAPEVGEVDRAHRMLKQFREKFEQDPDFLHRLATTAFLCGWKEQSIHDFEKLMRMHPLVRQYRIDAAQVYWRCDDRPRAKQTAEPLLNREYFPLPSIANDFFCDGFANWFLGHYSNADYDFQRSGLPANQHYRFLIG